MTMHSVAITNIAELTTNDPALGNGLLGRQRDAGLVIDNGIVAWVGASNDTPAADLGLDAAGGSVIPGFVDSHTHLIFGGERSDEFEARMNGERFNHGGILRTVDATRATSTATLTARSQHLADEMLRSGSTTIEVKSGYDLTVDGERRLLEVASTITNEVTFLGAHDVPPEFATRREDYVALVAGEMLQNCRGVAKWADAFCDTGAFSVEESRAVLLAAKEAGLEIRLHGNQLGRTGGVQLAIEISAASVDHCTHLSAADVAELANSEVVATLLPTADFCTRSPYPNARALLDSGVTVALATDCNPGTSFVTSMPFVIALAVRELAMSPDEALYAATSGGAKALRRCDVGHLSIGAVGNLVILSAPRAAHLAYRPGSSLVSHVVRNGIITSLDSHPSLR